MLFQESPFPSASALPCSYPSRKHSLYRLYLHFTVNYLFNFALPTLLMPHRLKTKSQVHCAQPLRNI